MIKISENKFINENKVLSANIYQKDGVIRVAIELDATSKEMATVYAGPYTSVLDAERFILSIPTK